MKQLFINYFFIITTILVNTIGLKSKAQTLSDYDGNTYGIVQIGSQKWINANLRATHFSNGDTIPTTAECNTIITGEFEPKYYWAYNCDSSLIPVYGLLYTWHVASDARKVCPLGWHVPSHEEYQTLESFLGGSSVAGGKLKETGTSNWMAPNIAATNEYAYNGVPNGNRNLIGTYNGLQTVSDTWTSSAGNIGARDFDLNYDVAATTSYDDNKEFAFAIRCVNDTLFIPIKDSNNLESILIYPNPSKDLLYLHSPLHISVDYQIISIQGQLCLTGKLVYGLNQLQLNQLNSGVYLLQLRDGENTTLTRIAVE